MQIRALLLIILLAWMSGAVAQAQPSAPQAATPSISLSLEEAVALGLRDNRQLRSVRLWRVVERFDLVLARRAYLPTSNVAVSAIRRKSSYGEEQSDWSVSPELYWTSPVGTQANIGWTHSGDLDRSEEGEDRFHATLRQPLLRGAGWDVNMAPLRQARINDELSQLRQQDAVADLIDRIVYAYRDLIQAQETLGLAEAALERSRDLMENNRLMIEAGRMAAFDIIQTESDVANEQVALLEAQRNLGVNRTRLLNLLALESTTPIVAIEQEEPAPTYVDADDAVQAALQTRRDFKALRLEFEALVMAEKLAKNNRLWDLSVVAQYDRYNGRDFLPNTSSHAVGIQLNVPLADLSGRRNVRAAQTALLTAELNYEDSVQRLDAQVREAVSDVNARWRQLEAAMRAGRLARESLEMQRERLLAGRASNFEVLSMQTRLRNADVQTLSARIAYLNALTSLDQVLGRTLETWRISLES